MNRHSRILTSSFLALLVAHVSMGQVRLSETQIPGTTVIRSVIADGNTAFVSQFVSSRQQIWDVSNPFAPVPTSAVYDPPSGDQWHDAHYYDGPEGTFLFQACRFGDLNMMDVSNATTITQVATEGTNYHWNGIETWRNETTNTLYLACSEANTNPFGVGGVLLYRVDSTGLTPLQHSLLPLLQGFDLKFSPDGRYVYQLGELSNNGTDEMCLFVHDLGNPMLPTYPNPSVIAQTLFQTGSRATGASLDILSDGTRLYAALGDLGLWTTDVSNPASPAHTQVFPGVVHFRDLVRYEGLDNVIIGTANLNGVSDSGILFGMGFPSNPAAFVPLFATPTLMNVNSLQMNGGRIFIGGNRTSAGGVGVFQIWI